MIDFDKQKRVIVEGADDLSVISNLWRRKHPDDLVPKIVKCEGVENLAATFEGVYNPTSVVGIVVDADEDVSSRYQRFKQIMTEKGIQPVTLWPDVLPSNGLVMEVSVPGKKLRRIGLWVMPDNVHPGALEQFLIGMLPEGDDLRPEAQGALERIEAKGLARYDIELKHDKALISTWLAWQSNPRMLYGDAIANPKLINLDSPACKRFIAWLERLFGIDGVEYQSSDDGQAQQDDGDLYAEEEVDDFIEPSDSVSAMRRRYGHDISQGWFADILWSINDFGKDVFRISELFDRYELFYESLHPMNITIRETLRAVLHELRDMGHIRMIGSGVYQRCK